ncbi:RpiB/LacA/LacB family sugar-phosphate isomerase [Patescibacteria group bacterium]|nr:MAG: RpiB/LacA/LacB family sugar-phosphate isomerase [Patescibacteria group bacterium]
MIYIAADHGGYQLKKHLLRYMKNELNIEAKDMGAGEYVETDDYPDFALPLAEEVAKDDDNFGILICASGQGMCIAANKVRDVRAILGYNIKGVEMGRRDNNANVLCLAGKILSDEHAAAIVKTFLKTEFSGEDRYKRRLNKIQTAE